MQKMLLQNDRQGGEVKITPEMIEAGAKQLQAHLIDVGPYSAKGIAVAVYTAMANLKVSGELAD
jgi:hypothetical protein